MRMVTLDSAASLLVAGQVNTSLQRVLVPVVDDGRDYLLR